LHFRIASIILILYSSAHASIFAVGFENGCFNNKAEHELGVFNLRDQEVIIFFNGSIHGVGAAFFADVSKLVRVLQFSDDVEDGGAVGTDFDSVWHGAEVNGALS